MQKYQETVISAIGRPVVGAAVRVTTLAGAAATIYSDNGITPISSLVTDATGAFGFYAADGRYTVTISGSGFPTRVISDVLLEDPATGGDISVTVGTTSRPLQGKIGERISVKDYGAVGDGVADDYLSIQGCIAAVLAVLVGGATAAPDIHFPAGNYRTSSKLTAAMPSLNPAVALQNYAGISLVGDGSYQTRIINTGTDYALQAVKGQCSIRGLQIDCGTVGNGIQLGGAAGASLVTSDVVFQSNMDDVRIIRVKPAGIGLQCKFVWDSSFSDVLVLECGAGATAFDIPANTLDNCNNLTFQRCMSETDSAVGITHLSVVGTASASLRHGFISFVGCHFEGLCSHTLFSLKEVSSVSFMNCAFTQKVGSPDVVGNTVNAFVFDNTYNVTFHGGQVALNSAPSAPPSKLMMFKNGTSGISFRDVYFSPYAYGDLASLYDTSSLTDSFLETISFENCGVFNLANNRLTSRRWLGSSNARFGDSVAVTGSFAVRKTSFNNLTTPGGPLAVADALNVSQHGGISSDKATTIANGANASFSFNNSTNFTNRNGMFLISAIDAGAFGAVVIKHANTLVAVAAGGLVDLNTSTPAAGHYGLVASGDNVTVYNNIGASRTFYWLKLTPSD